jgi:DNA repair exonuclease SbcCD ATPase subunit
MIYFKYIRWKNILSTGNAWTEIKLNKSKSTLIVGENGAGKSTILDALSYGLYSKPFRKITRLQMINSINGKGAEIQVEFDIGKHSYRIEREIKKYGSSRFEIYKNNELINQSANARDYQEYLEKNILKLNHKSFSQIVVLGSATFMPFMQLTAAQRREVIEDILDIEIFSTMNVLLKDRISTNKEQLNDATYQCDLVEQKIEMQEQHINSLKKNNDKLIKDNEGKITKYKADITSHEADCTTYNEQINELKNQISDKETIASKKKKIEQLEYKIKEKIKTLEKEIDFYEHYDNCPTCKQEIDTEFKSTTVSSKGTALSETTTGFEQLQAEYKKISDRLEEIQDVQEEINDLLTKVNNLNSQINATNRMIQTVEQEITELSSDVSYRETEDQKLDEMKQSLESLQNRREELITDKSVLDVAQHILKDTGIKTKIIRQYIPVMNKLINKYLAAMDFFVQFELDENFDETIKSRFRDEFSYSSFSEGEKMRIDLALLFTWRSIAKLRNSVSTNLLIMDEVFDSSLDSTGTEEFMKIMNELTSDSNIFVISHKGDQLYDKFHSVIKFEKHKNFSRVAA